MSAVSSKAGKGRKVVESALGEHINVGIPLLRCGSDSNFPSNFKAPFATPHNKQEREHNLKTTPSIPHPVSWTTTKETPTTVRPSAETPRLVLLGPRASEEEEALPNPKHNTTKSKPSLPRKPPAVVLVLAVQNANEGRMKVRMAQLPLPRLSRLI
jgi:hypothetical protein